MKKPNKTKSGSEKIAGSKEKSHETPSEVRKRNQTIALISKSLISYLQFPFAEIDYQLIADTYQALSGAPVVILNCWKSEDSEFLETMAISGRRECITLIEDLLGLSLLGCRYTLSQFSLETYRPGRVAELPLIPWLSVLGFSHEVVGRVPRHIRVFGIPLKIDNRIVGSVLFVLFHNTALEDGDLLELHSRVVTDILRRHEVETRLRETREHYEGLFEVLPYGVLVHAEENTIVRANQSAAVILGAAKPEDLPGMNVMDLVHPGDRASIQKKIDVMLKQRNATPTIQHRVIRLDGKVIDIEATGIPFSQGDHTYIQTVFRAITRQKRFETERLRAGKFRAFGLLASGIAHDFNNALSVIHARLDLAQSYNSGGRSISTCLDEIRKAAEQAGQLTKQLLYYAQGKKPRKQKASIASLLRDVILLTAAPSTIQCQVLLPQELWMVEVDPTQIGQVINNLVTNALEAMPKGGTLTLRAANVVIDGSNVTPIRQGKYVRICVEDTGFGIPEQNLPHVFDPYFTTKDNGTGLGLAIVYSLLQKNDGHISVESTPGRGTTFTIHLPALTPGNSGTCENLPLFE